MCEEVAEISIWEGRLPVIISLSSDEIVTRDSPAPFVTLVSRVAYFPFLEAALRSYFSESIPPFDENMWIDFQGVPLKWHLPIGVIFDLVSCFSEATPAALPWQLTVHFQRFPEHLMPRCRSLEVLRFQFFNALKQSTWMRLGSSKCLSDLPMNVHNMIWDSLRSGLLRILICFETVMNDSYFARIFNQVTSICLETR
jgi:autophagy-related protein 5